MNGGGVLNEIGKGNGRKCEREEISSIVPFASSDATSSVGFSFHWVSSRDFLFIVMGLSRLEEERKLREDGNGGAGCWRLDGFFRRGCVIIMGNGFSLHG